MTKEQEALRIAITLQIAECIRLAQEYPRYSRKFFIVRKHMENALKAAGGNIIRKLERPPSILPQYEKTSERPMQMEEPIGDMLADNLNVLNDDSNKTIKPRRNGKAGQ